MITTWCRGLRPDTTEFLVLTTKPRSRSSQLRVILAVVLLFSPYSAFSQSEPPYKFFKGRVKSCNEQCYRAKGREGYIDKTVHKRPPNTGNDFEIQYDSLGKKLLKIELDIDGEQIKRKQHYTYDGYNQLAEVRIVSKFGTLIKSTRYWNTVDSSGRLLGRYVDFSDQSASEGYSYSYSPNGKAYEYFLPKSGFPQKQLASREFDSAGNVTKYWSYAVNGNLTGYAVLTYDSLGNKILEELFNKHGSNYLNYSWKFEGGHDALRYEICKENSTNCESWTYKYEYDKTGNWIRRTEYRNGKLVYLTERKFTYW
jgi:hypothetical protein